VLLALGMTWPLAARLDRTLGGRVFPFDQYVLMYVLEWGRHVLPDHPGRFFDASLCYPARRMLGTVEHLLGRDGRARCYPLAWLTFAEEVSVSRWPWGRGS
jgi:hypothetical protein